MLMSFAWADKSAIKKMKYKIWCILKINLLNSGGKGMICKIWVWKQVCAKFWDSELERLSILSWNQLEGTLGRPFKPGAIFCHFLIWINRPHPTHHSTMGMWGGVASAFLSFSGNGRAGGGQLSGQCCKGLGLSNSPVSGKSYIEGRYNPQKPSLRQRTQTSLTDRRLYLGIWTESCWVEKKEGKNWASSQVFSTFLPFWVFLRDLILWVCVSLWTSIPQQSPYKWCLVCRVLPSQHGDYISKTVNFDVGWAGGEW